jgi:hypothetical protein
MRNFNECLSELEEGDIEAAFDAINSGKETIAPKNQSTGYSVLDKKGKPHPPKEVLRIAVKLSSGYDFDYKDRTFGGSPTNNVLIELGYKIVNVGTRK